MDFSDFCVDLKLTILLYVWPSLKNCLQLPTRGLKVWVGRSDFFFFGHVEICSIYFV